MSRAYCAIRMPERATIDWWMTVLEEVVEQGAPPGAEVELDMHGPSHLHRMIVTWEVNDGR